MFQWTTYNEKPQTVPPVNRVPIGEAQYERIVSRRRRNLSGLSAAPDPVFLGPPIYNCEGGPRGGGCAQQVPYGNDYVYPVGSATGGPYYAPSPGVLPGPLPSPNTTEPTGGIAGFLQNIPTSYLLIGGAVGLWFLMKKR